MEDRFFNELKKLYGAYGHRLFIVGGTTRDLLLGRPYVDHDFVTDATPEEEKEFLPDASYAFAKYGSVKLYEEGQEIDLTTLRVEGAYKDFRHPSKITFVKDPQQDYVRRDFTINALYLDEEYRLLDFCGGLQDLKNHVIRFIGDPDLRVREDPLRILRAERFAKVLGFSLEEKTKAAIDRNRDLLKRLNPDKIKEEERKLRSAVK
jgi:tRNA nucleotidyltransferase (CCA-adding enzyme)